MALVAAAEQLKVNVDEGEERIVAVVMERKEAAANSSSASSRQR